MGIDIKESVFIEEIWLGIWHDFDFYAGSVFIKKIWGQLLNLCTLQIAFFNIFLKYKLYIFFQKIFWQIKQYVLIYVY